MRRWFRQLAMAVAAPVATVVFSAAALAEEAKPAPPAQPVEAAPQVDDAEQPSTVMLDSAAFEQRLQQAEALVRNNQPTLLFGGYVDLGFFVPGGNGGAGYIEDVGHSYFPQYDVNNPAPGPKFGWVFLGDILAPAVNTRGEVADLGTAPGVTRYDSIHSQGAPGFVVNEVNLTARSALTPTALVSASINFTPRTGSNFALGDAFDVDIAQLEWLPTESQRTSIFVGKVDSVLGVEYRERKSDRRFGITPSLIARYTTGTALGVKIRSKFGRNDWLVVAAAITNGSFTTEQFHFYDEIDSNAGKTASARLAVRLPFGVELGFSGSYGPQDRTTNGSYALSNAMWFAGPDLLGHWGRVDVKAELLKGSADGDASEGVYGLRLHKGGYLELDGMLTPSFGFLARGEFRDAFVWLGSERAYLTKSWRATGGLRWVVTPRAVVKAEYLHNGEYGDIPSIPNDVFTTSLVMGF